ncbi:MAG: M3 family oligoendopeptidase, partial [Lachnospiraceae bacterium]|nr:M3 family oligoendopeptidase [Lachnospiraceae bacterium]
MMKFQDMPYERPDADALKKAYEEAAEKLLKAETYGEARSAFLEVQEEEEKAETMESICYIRNTIDTTDAFYNDELLAIREADASLIPVRQLYQKALSGSIFRGDLEKEFGPQLLRLVDASLKSSDERIVPEVIREGEVSMDYQKDSAAAFTEFRGEKCNFYGLLKHMESTDREERREAFLAWAGLYKSISGKLDARYDELVSLRVSMAEKMGFKSYTDLAYLNMERFDYGPEQAAAFRRQIREIVTPAVEKLRERQRKRLGLDRLFFYDETFLFPEGNPSPIGTTEELVEKAQAMYREMSPETGEFFDFMVKYRLFDLKTRPGKHMGGYMASIPAYKAPFIFSNFNGTSADVDVLTHEAGHAFQGYLAMRSIPVSMLSGSTSEINEIHSMTMEHFAYPWMGSFF